MAVIEIEKTRSSNPAVADSAAENFVRNNWTRQDIAALFALPLLDLVYRAQEIHRRSFDPKQIQISTLLSIKTGGCPEDCAYCPQSSAFSTSIEPRKLMDVGSVLDEARAAKAQGASRFCMGAAWRSLKDRDVERVCAMIEGVKALGMEACITLGMLSSDQATRLKHAGLDYYNHNIDTSPEHYGNVITTRTFRDRLDTLDNVRRAGLKVCCGGIVGMGETLDDRIGFIHALATMPMHPESVPINSLVAVAGTPLAKASPIETFDFVRTIAAARITMPLAMIRLSAGRETMSDEAQALCFLAGANSIFCGPKLLTTPNSSRDRDATLFERLGLVAMESDAASRDNS